MTTDHLALAIERLATATDVRAMLDVVYAEKPTDVRAIAKLHDSLRHNMAVSRMHATIADVVNGREQTRALHDLRASVDQLFQALTADPEPTATRTTVHLHGLPGVSDD